MSEPCHFCGKRNEYLPFKCHYCGRYYCSKHRQPENHNCKGLKWHRQHHKGKWFNAPIPSLEEEKKIAENVSHSDWVEPEERTEEHREHNHNETKTPAFVRNSYYKIKHWLLGREHNAYDYDRKIHYVIKTITFLIISVIAFAIIYSNITKLNAIAFWIIKIGSVLLLVSIYFIIKFGYRTIKEIINWIDRQRNWLKYLIIIVIIMLVWQGYTHRTTLLNPAFDYYNKTDISGLLFPLDIKNVSWGDKATITYGNGNQVTIPTTQKGIYDTSKIEARILQLVNEERARNGVRALTSNANLNSLAIKHSQRMINEDFFEHSRDNVGENIGEVPIHYNVIGCGSTYGDESMAQCFVTGWIESSGHHQNMIDSSYSITGVGVACSNSLCRATQNFM